MGRLKDPVGQYFVELDSKASEKRQTPNVVCQACFNAYNEGHGQYSPPAVIAGRPDVMQTHLKHCQLTQLEAQQRGDRGANVSEQVAVPTVSSQTSSPCSDALPSTFTETPDPISSFFGKRKLLSVTQPFDEPFSAEKTQQFQALIFDVWAECNLSPDSIEYYSVKRLFTFLNPACADAIPSRQMIVDHLRHRESSRELHVQKENMLRVQKASATLSRKNQGKEAKSRGV